MTRSLQCLVTGKVQGVMFRAWVHDQAASLGVRGWVRNLSDGKVEVLAQGDDAAIKELQTRLLTGSALARVEGLDCKWIEYDKEYPDFHVRG
jgi:acylphosphatase